MEPPAVFVSSTAAHCSEQKAKVKVDLQQKTCVAELAWISTEIGVTRRGLVALLRGGLGNDRSGGRGFGFRFAWP
jgi:hypothetical protein